MNTEQQFRNTREALSQALELENLLLNISPCNHAVVVNSKCINCGE